MKSTIQKSTPNVKPAARRKAASRPVSPEGDKLRELKRQREIALWRAYAYYCARSDGITVVAEFYSVREELQASITEFLKAMPSVDARVSTVWRAQAARLHQLEDRMLRTADSYEELHSHNDKLYREAWFRFIDADRAVEKEGGESALGLRRFPGLPDGISVDLQELEDQARSIEGRR